MMKKLTRLQVEELHALTMALAWEVLTIVHPNKKKSWARFDRLARKKQALLRRLRES